MPKVGDAFPSNYLKASDLGGKRVVVIIDRHEQEAIGRDKQIKPILYFQGKEKGLVLNKTNANKIASILGTDEMDDWPGGAVCLFGTMVEFGGEEVEGIRVAAVPTKPASKPAPKAAPAPPSNEGYEDVDDESVPF